MQTPLTMLLALSVLSLAVNVFAKDVSGIEKFLTIHKKLNVHINFFQCDKAQRKATTVGQVGSGYGEISQAPRWLQEERSALYFPLRHKSRYMFEHSKVRSHLDYSLTRKYIYNNIVLTLSRATLRHGKNIH